MHLTAGKVAGARAAGYYVAAVYREKASGARQELLRMVADLQPGEVVVAEKIRRISRLPLSEAELLVVTIRARGARPAVPGIVDLTDLVADSAGVAPFVLKAVQERLLRVAARRLRDEARAPARGHRDRHAGWAVQRRKPDVALHRRIVGLRETGMSIARTAELAGCCIAQVKRVTALHGGKRCSGGTLMG